MALSDLSTAGKAIKSILGGAPPDRQASLRLRKDLKLARQGDAAALQRLEYRARTQGSKFKNINRKAAKYYELVMSELGRAPQRGNQVAGYVPPTTRSSGWEASDGRAGGAGSSSTPQWYPQESSPSAPRAPKQCKYGPPDPVTNRCPPRPRASELYGPQGTRTAAPRGRTERPCKYGDRVNGRCPPRPRTSRARQTAERRLEQGVERAVMTGGRRVAAGAVKYAPAVLRFAAQAGLVLAAGAAAYWVTSRIMKMRNATVQDIENELAQSSLQAKTAYREQYGREMTGPELTELRAWYRRKLQYVRSLGAPNKKIPFTVRFED